MDWKPIILVAIAIVAAVIGITYKIKKAHRMNSAFEKNLIDKGFEIDNKIVVADMVVFADFKNKFFCVKESNDSLVEVHKFSDLSSFEMIDNGRTVIRGNLEEGLAGAFEIEDTDVFKYKDHKSDNPYCVKLEIVINLKDSNQAIKLLLIKGKTHRYGDIYKGFVSDAGKIILLLFEIIKN